MNLFLLYDGTLVDQQGGIATALLGLFFWNWWLF